VDEPRRYEEPATGLTATRTRDSGAYFAVKVLGVGLFVVLVACGGITVALFVIGLFVP
jgi:hypothetical protein